MVGGVWTEKGKDNVKDKTDRSLELFKTALRFGTVLRVLGNAWEFNLWDSAKFARWFQLEKNFPSKCTLSRVRIAGYAHFRLQYVFVDETHGLKISKTKMWKHPLEWFRCNFVSTLPMHLVYLPLQTNHHPDSLKFSLLLHTPQASSTLAVLSPWL